MLIWVNFLVLLVGATAAPAGQGIVYVQLNKFVYGITHKSSSGYCTEHLPEDANTIFTMPKSFPAPTYFCSLHRRAECVRWNGREMQFPLVYPVSGTQSMSVLHTDKYSTFTLVTNYLWESKCRDKEEILTVDGLVKANLTLTKYDERTLGGTAEDLCIYARIDFSCYIRNSSKGTKPDSDEQFN